MLTHFDAARADRLTNRSQPCPSVPWVESFIKVKERAEGQSSGAPWSGLVVGSQPSWSRWDNYIMMYAHMLGMVVVVRDVFEDAFAKTFCNNDGLLFFVGGSAGLGTRKRPYREEWKNVIYELSNESRGERPMSSQQQ